MTYPFDDADMTYSMATHRYTLTVDCVKRELGIDLGVALDSTDDLNPSTLGSRTLEMISRHIYRFIYSANSANKNYTEYRLAKDANCRQVLKEAMLDEVFYAIKNGDFWHIQGNETTLSVSADALALLREPLPDGFLLLYQGTYGQYINVVWREDY